MKPIPETPEALVLRTDFSDDSAWIALVDEVRRPHGLFQANCSYVSDPAFAGLQPRDIAGLLSDESRHTFMFLADSHTFSTRGAPLLAVDLFDDDRLTFRVEPESVGCVENNLSLGNVDFFEYADELDEDGVFRFRW